ncbi:MAG: GGDEF domain-containing protein [Oscillospiraceae bacterium]|nr:GGDEF domain-containing protein [Oscillospiraceae bacterium]
MDQQGVYINEQIQGRFAQFFVCQLIFLIGVFLFSIGFYFALRVQKRMQTMALGLVAILSGMWAGMETLYLQLITGNAAACHFINYLTLIFLPVPAILLVANITSSEKSRAILLINAMVFVNAAAQILCTLKGICDYHQMLWITHSVIIFTGLTSIFLAARSIHQHRENLTKYRMIIGAFSLFLVTGIIDIIRYHQGMSYGTFFTAGIFIFVVYLGYFEVRELVRMAEESAHAAELDRLAHMDGLTGLKNRLAFGEYEETICKSDSTYTIMQFDVNNLKKVNDEFGHNAGDKQICAAARIISDSFGALGHVFRTGGDEFIAILGITSDAEALSHSMECFSQYIEDYNVSENPPVMLSIAVGMAEFRGETNALNEAESLADQRMYTNKKQLKGLA